MWQALIVLIPLAGAFLPNLVSRWLKPAYVAGALTALALGVALYLSPSVFDGGTLIQSWSWMPEAGLNLAFRLDGYSLLFVFLILGIGLLVVLYAHYYLGPEEPVGRFYSFLLLFMGAMLGVVTSENLLLLVVFWELTGLSSFLLIGFWSHMEQARQGARLALLITGAGGLALLAGVLLLGSIVGSYELTDVLAAGDLIKADARYPIVLALVLGGAFTKSAQFPFHFWLPHAMSAPTPVSAYLHSATMVKAGVFLLGRLFPALAGTPEWFFAVGGAGITTLVVASYIALYRHDLKGLLAYSTVSHLGLITLLFGIGSTFGAIAAVFHIINHAVFKASLFMSAGIIDHETGTRDIRRLGGLVRYMPQTALLATVAAGAMAGVPLLNGFLSKEMFFAESFNIPWLGDYYWVPPLIATVAGVFTVAYSARFVHDVFFGPSRDLPKTPHEPPLFMRLPVAILVVLCLVVGLLPEKTVRPLLDVAVSGVVQSALPDFHIKIWHGFNLPFAMSLVALAGGAAVYYARRFLYDLHGYSTNTFSGKAITERAIVRLLEFARRALPRIENTSLQRYMLLLVLTALALGYAGMHMIELTGDLTLTRADPVAAVVAGLLCVTALMTAALHRQRLYALIAMGVVGLAVSLVFVRLSAPDLALTQLLVEIVTIILLLLAMYFLPAESPRDSSTPHRARDIAIGALAGSGVAALTWSMLTRPVDTIAGFYLDQSKPLGGGYNVVNVILVDFRGFDTLGEITVLGIAAVGIVAILKGLYAPARARDWLDREWSSDRYPMMLGIIARPLLPLALLVSVYIFLRGHNAPGGGFIAGLVTGTALILQYIAHGSDTTQPLLRMDFVKTIAIGLIIAVMTGLGSWYFDAPFLTSTFGYVNWPVVGEFELASAMAFDLGVYVVVVGTVLAILASLGQLSTASRERI